jgi:RNA-directed DNA polymerase
MEAVVERENLKKALTRVKRNKGAAGIDGMTVEDLPAYLKDNWLTTRAQLLEGTYKPQPVRRVEIPKASGGMRQLGIPTVLDRFIQQAVMQVLQADWDRTFSEASFGFRPGRRWDQEAFAVAISFGSRFFLCAATCASIALATSSTSVDLVRFHPVPQIGHSILPRCIMSRTCSKWLMGSLHGFPPRREMRLWLTP